MFVLPDNWRSLTDAELADLMAAGSESLAAAAVDADGETVARINTDLASVRAELAERRRTSTMREALAGDIREIVRETVKEAVGELTSALAEPETEVAEGDAGIEATDEVVEVEDATDEVEGEESTEGETEEGLAAKKMDPEDEADGGADEDEEDANGNKLKKGAMSSDDSEPPAELAAGDTKLPARPKAGGPRATLLKPLGNWDQGDSVPMADTSEIFHMVARDLPLESQRIRVLSVDTSADVETLTGDFEEDKAILRRAIDKAAALNGVENSAGQALVASGGWGTPSQIKYDFFEMEGPVVSLNLPTVGIQRGGLQYLTHGGPTMADIIGTAATWTWTEANDQSASGGTGATKTSLKMPIPTAWTDTRLHFDGIVLENGNLVESAWPEHNARWLRLGALAHERHMNKWIVDGIVALAAALGLNQTQTAEVANDGWTSALTTAVEYQATRIREKYQMPRGVGFDSLFPSFTESLLRSDLSRRNGVDLLGVADSRIRGLLNSAGVSMQEPHDYHALTDENGPWPTSLPFLIWPNGTLVKGTGPSLTLGVFRSESQITTNDHTALWTEEAFSLMQFGPELREVTVTGATTGKTGAAGL